MARAVVPMLCRVRHALSAAALWARAACLARQGSVTTPRIARACIPSPRPWLHCEPSAVAARLAAGAVLPRLPVLATAGAAVALVAVAAVVALPPALAEPQAISKERAALAWVAVAPGRAVQAALPPALAEPQSVSKERAALAWVAAAPGRAVQAALLQSKAAVPVSAASALARAFPRAVRAAAVQASPSAVACLGLDGSPGSPVPSSLAGPRSAFLREGGDETASAVPE